MEDKNNFYKLLKIAIIMFFIIVSINIGLNIYFNNRIKIIQKKNFASIESLVQNIKIKGSQNNYKIIIDQESAEQIKALSDKNYKEFIIQYNENQSNWFNTWLTILSIILGVLGLIIPICFMKLYQDKKDEIDKLIEKTEDQKEKMTKAIEEAINQKKQMQLQVDDVNKKYNSFKEESEEINKKSIKMSKELNEVKAIAKYNKALNLIKEDKKEEAKTLIREAFELDNNNDEIIEEYVIKICYANKDYEKALNLLNQAIEINSNTWSHYFYKAKTLSILKRNNEAIPVMKIAIEKCMEGIQKAYCLAEFSVIYANLKNQQKFNECAEEAYKIFANESVVSLCAIAATIILDYPKMLKYYEALITFPGRQNSADYYNLIEACIFTKQYEKSLKYLEVYLSMIQNERFIGIYKDDYQNWMNELNNAEQTETIIKIKELVEQLEKRDRENDE